MYFVGTDIVSIKRLEKLINANGDTFLNKIFTNDEVKRCNNKSNPFIHFGGKFAAKEATKKALLSAKVSKIVALTSIEIKNLSNGAPFVKIKDNLPCIINISISHTREFATAVAILEIQ